MLQLNLEGIKDKSAWQERNVKLPEFDVQAMMAETKNNPVWVHFGAGNIFRGFIAALQQSLLNQELEKSGIIAADTFDYDIIDQIYRPHDNMTLMVSLLPDGTMKKEVIASIGAGLRAGTEFPEDMEQLKAVFRNPSLQMVSFTITEKGYALKNIEGAYLPVVQQDFENGPEKCSHAMSKVTALLLERFLSGGTPVAVVSMDNCSHNGEKLKTSVLTVVEEWEKRGFVTKEFADWVNNEEKVSFPWTMIDKITPRPAKVVEDALKELEIGEMAPVITGKNTYIAPFVNAEEPQYLVVEDRFPNGRPALEKAGVYMTDRDTVNDTERMKVTTCLNPLHTALAVYGCMLGYESIAAEMKDTELKKLVELIGKKEGMPVVTDPKILSPEKFLDEVLTKRLPNPFIPDTPQRIATDTSQKLAIRFGETIKSYCKAGKDLNELTGIPLVIAGWLRYLLAVDDAGKEFTPSSDPMLSVMQEKLKDVHLSDPDSADGKLSDILTNDTLFGCDLYEAGIAEKVIKMFKEMLEGPGAVRKVLKKYL